MSPIVDPALTDPETVLGALDFAGVAVFAATGALAAAQQRHDLVTFAFFGAITGVGGGTLRDLLIGAPVFWVQDWRYIAVCLLASLAVWMVGARPWRFRALLWLDAIGLAIVCVTGAHTALVAGVGPSIAVAMGVASATFGGIIRDVLGGESPIVLRKEIYVTAALFGALVAMLVTGLEFELTTSLIAGFVTAFAIRAAALHWNLSLPRYQNQTEV